MNGSKRVGKILFIILFIALFLGAIIGIVLSSVNREKENNMPQLTMLSCDEKVFYGGDFSLNAAYLYPNGEVESVRAEDIVYTSSDETLIKVENGSLIVVESNIESRSEYLLHEGENNSKYAEVQVSVKSKNATNTLEHNVKIFKQADYLVTVQKNDSVYFNDDVEIENTYGVMAESNISALCELDNNGGTIEKEPVLDSGWNFDGWYIVKNDVLSNERFYPEDLFMYNQPITIRARFKTDIELDGDDIGTNSILDEAYYNEQLPSLKPCVSNHDGWTFSGWYSNVGGEANSGIEFKSGDIFTLRVPKLYAKWEGIVKLNLSKKLDYVLDDGIWKGATTPTEETVGELHEIDRVYVVYHAPTPKLAEPKYENGGIFKGWQTQEYGAGVKITEGEIFNTNSLNLYDCFAYKISFIDADGKNILSTVNADGKEIFSTDETSEKYVPDNFDAIYGQSIRLSNENKSLNESKTEKDNWTFAGWFTQINDDQIDIREYYRNGYPYIETKTKNVQERWSATLRLHGVIDSFYDDTKTVYYGQDLNLTYGVSYDSWRLMGWYNCEAINFNPDVSIEYSSLKEYKEGDMDLYALWYINEVTLKFNNGKQDQYIKDVYYGVPLGNKLPNKSLIGSGLDGYNNDSNYCGWYNLNCALYENYTADIDKAVQIYDNTINYPSVMNVIYYIWMANTYSITLDTNNGIGGTQNVTAIMGQKLPMGDSIIAPTKNNTGFTGYYYGDDEKPYYILGNNNSLISCRDWDIANNATLTAHWSTTYAVSLMYNFDSNDSTVYNTINIAYLLDMPKIAAPTREGYDFIGFFNARTNGDKYYDRDMNSKKGWNKESDGILYAQWSAHNHKVTISASGASSITVSASSQSVSNNSSIAFGTSLTVNITHGKNNKSAYLQYNSNKYHDGETSYSFPMPDYDVTIYATSDNSCFAQGTRILMADGGYKNIEDVKVGDIVISWNFTTGQLEAMPVALYWYHGMSVYDVLNLSFSDGKALRIIGSHGLFDYDLNQYIYLTTENYNDYIGHSYVIYDAIQGYNSVTLVNAYVTSEEVGNYSLRTACNDNAFAEGLLTLTPEDFPGYLTYFEVGENMKYDEEKMQSDIEMYGLFTYTDWLNDWSEYITYEEFIAFNGQYFKILLGKGILTYEDILTLIDGLRNGSDIQS